MRVEIRRVSGDINKDQVYWGKGDDGKGIYVFNPDGIEFIDDASRGKPPFITFEFKFREDPEITQRRMLEEKADTKIGIRVTPPVTRKSLKSGTLALPAINKAEGTSFHASARY